MPAPKSEPSAIIWKDKTPVWNLSEITAYPVELRRKPVYVYLTPYAADELKNIMRRAPSSYKRDKMNVEIFREDRNVYAPLCDTHFMRFGNVLTKIDGKPRPTTPDEDMAFLEAHPEWKSGIVEFAFGGLQLQLNATDDSQDTEVLDISAELSGSVCVFQSIYDPATDKVVRVDMTHYHASPTEGQYRQYRSARRSKFSGRTSLWTITEQHGTLEALYDAVITSVDGAAVNGEYCLASNKSTWVSGIPLWHKLFVVDQIFTELIEKNE